MKNTLKNKAKTLKLTTLGFSLIELLAVIVILAIITLIAAPIVLNIIDDTKESSLLRSAEFYLDAVETAIAQSTLNNKKLENKTYNILENGNLCMEYKDNKCIDELEVKVSGEVPKGGLATIEDGKIKDIQVVLSNKTMVKDNDKWFYSGLYDENDNLIASWDELVNDYGIYVEKNYPQNDSSRPGVILSTNEKLSKGVKLVIDSSVTKIGNYVFRNCTSLIEIKIPNSITSIGDHAFSQCTSLKEITIPSGVTELKSGAFYFCTNLKKIILPEALTSIGYGAIQGCENLTDIKIPNSVTIIDDQAFSDCSSLKEIILPKGLISLDSKAFYRCKSLEKITIPNSVTTISDNLFNSCLSLKEIILPNTITSIGYAAFHACKNLKTINYTGTESEWNSIQFGDLWNSGMPSDYTVNYNYVVR